MSAKYVVPIEVVVAGAQGVRPADVGTAVHAHLKTVLEALVGQEVADPWGGAPYRIVEAYTISGENLCLCLEDDCPREHGVGYLPGWEPVEDA